MEYQKAFDTVPHRRLVGRLASSGIRKEVLRWVKAFLNNRRHRVVVNGKSSEWTDVTSGIPQWSVLGPIPFVIYITICPMVCHLRSFLFVDDTNIFKKNKQKQDCDSLQNDLKFMQLWTDIWLIYFHPQKCPAITIRVKKAGRIQFTRWEGGGLF